MSKHFSKLCTWVSWGHRCPPPPSTAFTHLSPKCLPPPQHTAQIVQSTEAQMNFQMNGRKGELVAQMNGQAGGLPRWINRICCPRTTSRLIVHLNRQEDESCCPNEWTGNEFVAHKLEASLLAAASFRATADWRKAISSGNLHLMIDESVGGREKFTSWSMFSWNFHFLVKTDMMIMLV